MVSRGLAVASAGLVAQAACGADTPFGSSLDSARARHVGGENAGAIVSATAVHVHAGCTNGDFPGPIALDDDGRFSVAGEYLLRAYPVAIGPTMPAQFAGIVLGGRESS